MLSFFKKSSKPSIKFKFTKFGAYEGTTVKIEANIPFNKLHLLYKLPLMILKAYWGVVYQKGHRGLSNNILSVEMLPLYMSQEKGHVSVIEPIAKEYYEIVEFPVIWAENTDNATT